MALILFVSCLLSACSSAKSNSEIVFVKNGTNFDWWSYRDGLEKPISWLNSDPNVRAVSTLKQMKDTRFVAFVIGDFTTLSDTNYLVIFNRSDYSKPVAVTKLDPKTEYFSPDVQFTEQDMLPLIDRTTTPGIINLWSFDTAGTLTKAWSLGPEKHGGVDTNCAGFTGRDGIYMSPDGKKAFHRFETVATGSRCKFDENGMLMGSLGIKYQWQVVDIAGKVLSSGEKIVDYWREYEDTEWPVGWLDNQTILFSRFSPNGDKTRQCLVMVDVYDQTKTIDLYCDEDAPAGIDGFAVSPNGKYVAFVQDYHFLVVVDAKTANVVYSSKNQNQASYGYPFTSGLAWSPDSRSIAWMLNKDSANFTDSIFITQIEGTNKGQISSQKLEGTDPTYTYLWLK